MLAGLAGVDPLALRAATPVREIGSRAVRIGMAWTDVADLTGRSLRICTGCLAADREAARLRASPVRLAGWVRPEWLVRSIATCVVHRRPLEDRCQACGAPLGADNPAIDTCRCSHLQVDRPAVVVTNRVDSMLVALIAGGEVLPAVGVAGLHHVSSHLVRLGALTLGRSERPPALAAAERLAMRERGLEVALAGDAGLFRLLDDVVRGAPPGRSGLPGLVSSYGWAWRSWLGAPTGNPLDQALGAKVRVHAERRGIRSPAVAGGVTLEEARGILGSGHDRARRIVSGAGLLSGAELPGTPMSIDRGRVEAIAAELSGLLDGAMAARRLGIGRTQFRSLVAAGMVEPSVRAAELEDRPMFTTTALDRLVDGVAAGLPVIP